MDIIEAYVLTGMDLLFDRSVYRLYSSCKKRGFKFKMASIPEKMNDIITVPTEFNLHEMIKLFNLGYSIGNTQIQWKEKISFDEYDNNKY